MKQLTLVGLGPEQAKWLTLEAVQALSNADVILLRTQKHGAADYLKENGLAFTALDDLYEEAADFDALNAALIERILSTPGENVAFGVPGDGIHGEAVVQPLLREVKARGIACRFVAGVSAAAPAAGAAALEGVLPQGEGYALISAQDQPDVRPNPELPLIVAQLDNPLLTGACKLALAESYGDDMPAGLYDAGEDKAQTLPLYELDRQRVTHLSTLVLPAQPRRERVRYTFEDLLSIMRTLRGPQGCPWDKEQTHESLKPYVIEEAYEVADAIDLQDMDKLSDELGDLLLQVVFHAQVAFERGDFDDRDICTHICEKMIRRHPHIFADGKAGDAKAVLDTWEEIKKKEKQLRTQTEVMQDVPRTFPALMRAAKVQQKAKKVGFDWEYIEDALGKIEEESREFMAEYKAQPRNEDRLALEMGDLLFAVVNVARMAGIQPEMALNASTEKFIRRFGYVESRSAAQGRSLQEMTLPEMDALWEEAKAKGIG
ncbi:nucleoside triphosphate pyrophosphohydrolase [Luoshenia tenuis]|jgi:tetrapyrrole methylase family protein/MazG family protein|uniref:nucleoside triphosphate pyrophosphohydrolase n=1 Tax=Luoshenia tenuis TaxID=2763654 RepID=UPI003D92D17D